MDTVVLELQASAKSPSVFILLECFFPPTVVHQLKLGKRECPSKISCSSSKGRYHAGEEKGAGLPVKLGPGEQLFSRISAPSLRL